MLQMADLYTEAETQCAKIYMYNVDFAQAATLAEDVRGPYGIFIDMDSCTSVSELKMYLAHELGHCATASLNALTSPYELIERNEHRANRWAIMRYLPFSEIKAAMQHGYTERWQLADFFDVPQFLIEKAIAFYINNLGLDFND